jgi:hypothetical protein
MRESRRDGTDLAVETFSSPEQASYSPQSAWHPVNSSRKIPPPGGREGTAFVDRHQVIPDREISPSEEYKGQLKVTLVQVKNDSAVIDLPQASLTQGPRLVVPKQIVKTAR